MKTQLQPTVASSNKISLQSNLGSIGVNLSQKVLGRAN